MEPRFFASPNDFREWLAKHHATESELVVGFHKRHTNEPCMTWPESVDQALCYGWIDGLRKRIDEDRYLIRFTPRKSKSIWSKNNLKRIEELREMGLLQPAGLKVYEERDPAKANQYSFENEEKKLPPEFEAEFRKNAKAWTFFESQPPSYRRTAIFVVMKGKQEETRQRRFLELVDSSEKGERIKQLRPSRP